MTRSLILTALSVVLCGPLLFGAGSASAAPLSDCTPHRGTIVAVDFAHWGGPTVRGCGIDEPTGYALLHAAGFATAGDAHDGAAFVCRLGNQAFDGGTMYPTPSEAPCIGTPSTSAYWSYWLAPAGQNTWTYNSIGPMGDVPKPGEVELWMFGSTNVAGTHGSGVPKFPPSSLRAPTGAPPTHTSPAPSSSAPTTATRSTSAPASRAATTHRSTAKPRTTTGHSPPPRPARKHTRPPAPGRRAKAAASAPVVSSQPTSEHTSSGSVAPLVVGLCLALALVAGAVWTVWRRRQYG